MLSACANDAATGAADSRAAETRTDAGPSGTDGTAAPRADAGPAAEDATDPPALDDSGATDPTDLAIAGDARENEPPGADSGLEDPVGVSDAGQEVDAGSRDAALPADDASETAGPRPDADSGDAGHPDVDSIDAPADTIEVPFDLGDAAGIDASADPGDAGPQEDARVDATDAADAPDQAFDLSDAGDSGDMSDGRDPADVDSGAQGEDSDASDAGDASDDGLDAGDPQDDAADLDDGDIDVPPADDPDSIDQPEDPGGPADDVYGVLVPRAESWWVGEDGRVYYGESAVPLYGLNWFGLETFDRALHGLWSGRSVTDFLDQIVDLGFNALRVPLSPQSIRDGYISTAWANHDEVDTGREHLEELLSLTADAGIAVLLDLHTCDPVFGGGSAGRPDVCEGYEIADWHDDLVNLASLAAGYTHVVGIDLFNEPHELTWTAWRDLADVAAREVLETNPRLLVFVQGVGNASDVGGAGVFWGENLVEALSAPLSVPRSRLVFSPHVYGPGVFYQDYFAAEDFPDNLPAIWGVHFGYLASQDYPLAIGEFGGWYDDEVAPGEIAWNDAFVDYLIELDVHQFFFWSLNPNSSDTGGLLLDDWLTPHPDKLELLSRLTSR